MSRAKLFGYQLRVIYRYNKINIINHSLNITNLNYDNIVLKHKVSLGVTKVIRNEIFIDEIYYV